MKKLASFINAYLLCCVWASLVNASENTAGIDTKSNPLIETLAIRHQQLMTVVAVADIYFGCQQANPAQHQSYPHSELISKINPNALAEKLEACLNTMPLKSEKAIEYGLIGCISDQVKGLAEEKQQQHLAKLKALLSKLTIAEKQKNFTKCVNDQALEYL
jgi:hypothetical protein